MRINVAQGPAIPLSPWANRQLQAFAALTGSPRLSKIDGATLLGERASHGGYTIGGQVSAGNGGSRLLKTRDGGWFALTLMRAEDRELLPALFMDVGLDIHDDTAIASAVALHTCADLVARGRDLGLPVASADEIPVSAPVQKLADGMTRPRKESHRPLVIDLSSIWAGPLTGHLLWLAGAEVVKVESPARPDLIRYDDPATFDLINQGKANIAVDLNSKPQKSGLIDLICRADFVIESSRPRALQHLGIDADALVAEVPGLVWLTITGHGASGEAANWVGIGNDCAVAGGLSRALAHATGEIGYVGDAIADPLTGIVAALEGWRAYKTGQARRIGFAMSAITAQALHEERAHDPAALEADLHRWGAARGQSFPQVARRPTSAPARALGADNARYLPEAALC